MKFIIPMAGKGTRLRPHTLTTPKSLLKIAGKPIVQRLLEDLIAMTSDKVEEIIFILGNSDKSIETNLREIATIFGATPYIFFQKEPKGTADAILSAKQMLKDNIIVAYADTLFKANFKIDKTKDAIIWTKQVEDPSKFGIVKMNEDNIITHFIEKPQKFISNQAIIGIYFFKDGLKLRKSLEYLVKHNITGNGEYQLTDALENMRAQGIRFTSGLVEEWMDYGNKSATVESNRRYMNFLNGEPLIAESSQIINSVILKPVYIGENTKITDSVIGPYTSIGNRSKISRCIIKNSIIQDETIILYANCHNSMIGNKVYYKGRPKDLSVGDFNEIRE